ncbi:MAG TPA: DEAD/DEAH box helicase, partial [Anaeromyxobacter sp.]
MDFATADAHRALLPALAGRGYTEPTPVQAAVLAPALAEKDLLVSSRTGSGKTIAFGLLVAEAALGADDRFGKAAAPLALVVAPTRELAVQVQRELAWLFAAADGRVAACVGGMDPRQEARALKHGTHIVVGTPGRLRDHLELRCDGGALWKDRLLRQVGHRGAPAQLELAPIRLGDASQHLHQRGLPRAVHP